MNCPYCGNSDDVTLVGVPTAAMLVKLGPMLGLGVVAYIVAVALAKTYKAIGKRIYKCSNCDKYFIA